MKYRVKADRLTKKATKQVNWILKEDLKNLIKLGNNRYWQNDCIYLNRKGYG